MIRARMLCALLVALFATACGNEAPTDVPVGRVGPQESLRLVVPSLTPDLLVAPSPEEPDKMDASVATGGPAATEIGGEEAPLPESGDSELDISDYLNEVGTIYDAFTKVGWGPGYGFSYGEHKYQGNKGRVETTVTVSHDDQTLGTQTAVNEKYDMFLLDAGAVHFISATARFYTDTTCGLTARGHSLHMAWWEWFLGGSATSWGKAVRTTDAPAASQGDCSEIQTSGGSGGGGETTCYYWVTYDLATGEVYDVSLLYCETGG